MSQFKGLIVVRDDEGTPAAVVLMRESNAPEPKPDIRIQDGGSIILFEPLTDAGREWIDENIGEGNGYQPYWPTAIAERRYAFDIAQGMAEDGLALTDGRDFLQLR